MVRIAIYASASVVALGLAAQLAHADDKVEKIVVTASRIGTTPENRLGTAVTVIDRRQIEERQTRVFSDVLRDAPGVEVSRAGALGGLTQIRMRGGEGNHTLVLLDGTDISDPFQGEFDFSGLLAGDVERIEILRGSQSALYGSDAVGGAINFVARRGRGPLAVEAFGEAGSFDTGQTSANIGFGDEEADIFLSASHRTTSGTNNARFGSEADGARNTSVFLNAGTHIAPNVELRGFARYVDTYAETDPQEFFTGLVFDGDDTTASTQFYANVSAELSAWDGKWLTRLNYALADVDRDNDADGVASASHGERHKISLVSAVDFDTGAASHKITGAIDWKREAYDNAIPLFAIDASGDTDAAGYVLSYDLALDAFDAGAAYRHDANDGFKDADTYRLQASYRMTETTRLRATAGSGIKNPTFNELFGFDPGTFIGNPNLKPEKSVGWDVGVDQTFAGSTVVFTATYFQAELTDEIFTAFGGAPLFLSTPANRTTTSERRGVELTLVLKPSPDWTIDAAYTYLDADENGVEEVRRAPHIASLNLTHRFLDDRGSATVTVRYNGEQTDNHFFGFFPFQEAVTLDAFTLVNLNASYDVTDNIQLFGRVENLFDEKYEEVFSYRSPGIAAYAGLRAKF